MLKWNKQAVRRLPRLYFLCHLLFFFPFCLYASEIGASQEIYKQHLLHDLYCVKNILEVHYAPAQWKTLSLHWDLEASYTIAKNKILSSNKLSAKQYQQIVNQFVNATQDHHVKVLFVSTEMAILPFTVKGSNGRYFIDTVDEELLEIGSIQSGDELLQFDGLPIDEVIRNLMLEDKIDGHTATDQSLAEIKLTERFGGRGDAVPQGEVKIEIKSREDGIIRVFEFLWDYHPELILEPFNQAMRSSPLSLVLNCISALKPPLSVSPLDLTLKMLSPIAYLYPDLNADSDEPQGSFTSFLPRLGNVVWEPDNDQLIFDAYIFENENGELIGYVRIPDYVGTSEDAELFGELMNFYQDHVQALVIDQLNNPGGIVGYQYELAACLADKPLSVPQHRLSITQETVLKAYDDLDLIKEMEELTETDELFLDVVENEKEILLFKKYCSFVIDEWNKGHILTDLTYLNGIDFIQPHEKYRFTKPILILINELDFSGGDFFPAILQDNHRATLFGATTAGAGGCVTTFSFPNLSGIKCFYYTHSIAERPSGEKIENTGVKPDIEYQITVEDLQYHYRSYIEAVNESIQKLIKNGRNV